MSLKTPTPPGYGNSTHFLTLEAIEVTLTKDQTGNTDIGRKENEGTSSEKTNIQKSYKPLKKHNIT